MPKKLNLIGEKYGRLTVIESAPNRGKYTQWKCQCECGNICVKTTDSLRQGNTRSCGCLQAETARKNGLTQLKELTGQKFGLLTVIKYAGSQRGRSSWLCRCDCGNEVIVNQMELSRGDTLSCGCLRSSFGEKEIENILKSQQLKYQKEFSFNDLRSENDILLRFDFAVLNDNNEILYLIEYDGEQHYLNKTDVIWSDTMEKRRKRDRIKNEYALSHNIPLYRIPYWEKNNLTFENIISEKHLIK